MSRFTVSGYALVVVRSRAVTTTVRTVSSPSRAMALLVPSLPNSSGVPPRFPTVTVEPICRETGRTFTCVDVLPAYTVKDVVNLKTFSSKMSRW